MFPGRLCKQFANAVDHNPEDQLFPSHSRCLDLRRQWVTKLFLD